MASTPASASKTGHLPQWTQHVAVDGGGRDPLGLSRVGQILLDYLSPGIVLNTDRARYYALYCWMLWHIQEEEQPKDLEEFYESFQRREGAVAVATLMADAESSPVGVTAATKQLDQGRAKGQVNTQFQVLPANRLGGLGQYYSGGLYTLGLTSRPEDGIWRVTEGAATRIARAIHETIKDTPYVRDELFRESRVDLKALKKSSDRLSLDAIGESFAKNERELLSQLFLSPNEPAPTDDALNRRHTLVRLLSLVSAYEDAGIAVREKQLDDQLLYGPVYFGVLIDPDKRTRPATLPKAVRRSAEFWRQFCLHQYLAQALEGLLIATLRVLGSEPSGLSKAAVLDQLSSQKLTKHLRVVMGGSCQTPRELLACLGVKGVPDKLTSERHRAAIGFRSDPNEEIDWDDDFGPAEIVGQCCVSLAVLYAKWRGMSGDLIFVAVGEKAGKELSAPGFLPLLDEWLKPDLSWRAVLASLLDLVVTQHDQVMYGKGRLESCWLHQDGVNLVRDQDYDTYYRGSRQKQAVSILVDLGHLAWVERRGETQVVITAQGRRILNQVLEVGRS